MAGQETPTTYEQRRAYEVCRVEEVVVSSDGFHTDEIFTPVATLWDPTEAGKLVAGLGQEGHHTVRGIGVLVVGEDVFYDVAAQPVPVSAVASSAAEAASRIMEARFATAG